MVVVVVVRLEAGLTCIQMAPNALLQQSVAWAKWELKGSQ